MKAKVSLICDSSSVVDVEIGNWIILSLSEGAIHNLVGEPYPNETGIRFLGAKTVIE